jgi:DNA-directed RNA polymerase specialized sigma24 family protein
MSDVTRILSAIEHGDPHAAERLLPLVYEELRKLAAQKLAQEKPGQTLQATALVHEAYMRLVAGVALDEALTRLAALNPERADVVKLRFFAGLTMPEVAQALGLSLPTAERYWTSARTWLYAELKEDESAPG